MDVSSEYPRLFAEMERIAEEFVGEYRSTLMQRAITPAPAIAETMTAAASANDSKVSLEVTLNAYWRWIEHGRGPGKQPPLDAILEWVNKTQLQNEAAGEGITARQMAFLIARKIGREGTEPKWVLFDLMQKNVPLWKQRLASAAREDVVNMANEIFKKLNRK